MSRRDKALTVLRKVHDASLKERAGELTELQGRLGTVIAARADLHRMRREEASVSMPEAMPYVASFMKHLRREDQRLERAEEALHGHVERVREQVMERYRDLKSVENLQNLIATRRRDERSSREARDNDERNVLMLSRKT